MSTRESQLIRASEFRHFYLRFWLDGVITDEVHVVVPAGDWSRSLHGEIDCYKCRSPRRVTRTLIGTDENFRFRLEEAEFWRNVEWEGAGKDHRAPGEFNSPE